MKVLNWVTGVLIAGAVVGCGEGAVKHEETVKEEVIGNAARVPDSWIDKRVEQAKSRLQQTDAGKVVWNAMEVHGGLYRWYANGPVAFHFDYQPLNGSTRRNTYQVINTWNNTARHFAVNDSTAQFGWDGEHTWTNTTDTTIFPFDKKFWAITPYYFMAQPFVLDGEGVQLELLSDIEYKGENHDVVKVTFEDGTGDAPDDYYILYFNKASHKLKVIRYIVSYPEYFEGGGHSPEKFMELYGEQTIDGITLPERYQTHMLTDDQQPGEHVTDITLDSVSFMPDLTSDYFKMPENAEIIK